MSLPTVFAVVFSMIAVPSVVPPWSTAARQRAHPRVSTDVSVSRTGCARPARPFACGPVHLNKVRAVVHAWLCNHARHFVTLAAVLVGFHIRTLLRPILAANHDHNLAWFRPPNVAQPLAETSASAAGKCAVGPTDSSRCAKGRHTRLNATLGCNPVQGPSALSTRSFNTTVLCTFPIHIAPLDHTKLSAYDVIFHQTQTIDLKPSLLIKMVSMPQVPASSTCPCESRPPPRVANPSAAHIVSARLSSPASSSIVIETALVSVSASMNIDKPLEEIIAGRPKRTGAGAGRNSQRGRKGGRSGRPSAKAAAVGGGAQNAAVIAASNRNKPPVVIPGRGANTGSKIILSNLPLDVTEAQVKELFSTTIGPLRKVAMSYRANGQSTGVCTVEFQRADDAGRAYTQYNNRLIDGKKPLKVEVVVDPAKVAAAPAAAARGARGAAGAVANGARGKGGRAAAGAGAGAAKRGRGRGAGAGAKREARPKKTVEDLDAEMEDYNKQASTTDAAPAA